MKKRRSSSARVLVAVVGLCGLEGVDLDLVVVVVCRGRYWLKQADSVVSELRVLEKRLSSVEGFFVLDGMVSVTKEVSLRRVDIQGMDWKGVGSLVAMLVLRELRKVRCSSENEE
jgi:hypothetical protein